MPQTSFGRVTASTFTAALVVLGAAAAQAQGRFSYVADGAALKLMTLDPLTGDASLAATTSMPLGNPTALTVDSTGRFIYVTHGNSPPNGGWSSCLITSTAGVPVLTGLVQAGVAPQSVVGDAFGRFVYVASHRSQAIFVFTVNPDTGTLSPALSVTSAYARKLRLDPTGRSSSSSA